MSNIAGFDSDDEKTKEELNKLKFDKIAEAQKAKDSLDVKQIEVVEQARNRFDDTDDSIMKLKVH